MLCCVVCVAVVLTGKRPLVVSVVVHSTTLKSPSLAISQTRRLTEILCKQFFNMAKEPSKVQLHA